MSLTSYRAAPPRVTMFPSWLDGKGVRDMVNGYVHRLQCLATTYSSIA